MFFLENRFLKPHKIYKLKSKDYLNRLFALGTFQKNKLVGVRFIKNSIDRHYFGVSVSKSSFPKAVDRNKIKRRMRSCYTQNISFFINSLPFGFYLFIYLSNEMSSRVSVLEDMKYLVKKI
ncbi:MAG: hypothetical protein CMC79_03650 [Flavobacteriaceae bacterium]|nr:hypothetical protein [Flavobacteriaceae bacterium]|tara:strand:- start:41672 stop:42034 length:363 start_codon:yes stop_codon:yes gene_type:complete